MSFNLLGFLHVNCKHNPELLPIMIIQVICIYDIYGNLVFIINQV